MRVCFVSHSAGSAGGERSLLDLVDALSSLGVECRVLAPEQGFVTRALAERAVPHSVTFFRPWCSPDRLPLWDRGLKKPLAHLLRAGRVARAIRQWKCDVVVTNTMTVCEGALSAFLLRIPHVAHVREFGGVVYGQEFEYGPRLSMRMLSFLSRVVVFNSNALAKYYEREVPHTRARVVYNAVTVPAAAVMASANGHHSGDDSAFQCVLVGMVVEAKGPEEAIRAVHETVRRGLPVKLKIVGAGPHSYRVHLDQIIERCGLRSHVEILDYAADPFPFFREADVALMCSKLEAFGRVTVEAMKMGTPVIGVNSGGTPEIIRDGFNGLLYAPGDWRDLADKIQSLCADRELARSLGRQAKEWATRTFNQARYGSDMLSVLREAVDGAASGQRTA